MSFYRTCPDCGANLDPGEPCDCQAQKEQEKGKIQNMLTVGKGGQIQIRFAKEVSGIAQMGD